MSATKKTNRKQFWLVVLGLFLLIGAIAGGTYLLDVQGLINAGGEMQGGPPADMADISELADSAEGNEMPARPDHDEEGGGFSSQALTGMFQVMLQMSMVVVVIAGGQWLLSRLQRRRRRAPAHSG
jgi:hypothetical protein